jgi:hypothetical protein
MKTRHQILNVAIGLLILTACAEESEDKLKVHLKNVLEQKAYEQEVFGFILPDSIDKSRVVATYYDEHSRGHGIILYSDTIKKSASNLTFLPDSSVQRDILTQKSYNTFASVFDGTEYIVMPKYVTIIVDRNGTCMTHDNERIDN